MSTHKKYESSLPASENMHMPLTDTNYANMTWFLCKPEKRIYNSDSCSDNHT